MENTLLSIYVIIEEGKGSEREREGKREGRRVGTRAKRKDSKEKITLQFVLLAVRTVNGKYDRLVLALITRRDSDYRLSAT